MFAHFSLLYNAACVVVQWSKGILKSVILISSQIEKFRHKFTQIRSKSCSYLNIWEFTPDSNHMDTVSQKQDFVLFSFYSWYYSLIHYSQYSRSFVFDPCAPSGKYLQLSSGDLKDTSLFYTMSRSSYQEVFPSPQGSCFYQLLNSLH